MTGRTWNVLVTGGAGYVGSALVPRLLDAGHRVTVLDLYIYGEDVLAPLSDHPGLRQVKGDIRDTGTVAGALAGCDAVIHLACLSNDPSCDLDPALGKSINLDPFRPLVRAAKAAGVKRFVNASSSSVYGIKDAPEVTEDMTLDPLTDYSRYKALCEDILADERGPGFVAVTVRPATVCGYAPRLRLDLTVNILTNHAVNNRRITVFGGSQKRPNLHIDDMAALYLFLLQCSDEDIDGQTFNAGYENHSVMEIARMVRGVVGDHIEIEVTPTDDLRSYHVCSEKLHRRLGFRPRRSIPDAVTGLVDAFAVGKVPDALDNARYFNIKRMRELDLH